MSGSVSGEISATAVYTLEEFKRRVGLAEWAFRECKRAGLKCIKIGRRKYIRGSDWLEFLDRQAEQQAG